MNVLILNGSPKRRFSASAFFSRILRLMLFPHSITTINLAVNRNYEGVFEQFPRSNAVVLAVPLYVDGIPSHILRFLKAAEEYCRKNPCSFVFYVISNSGFIEGRNSQAHLEQYRCWCERSHVTWGSGLGIGGGVMLHVIFYFMFLLNIAQFLISALVRFFSRLPPISMGMVTALSRSIAIWIFLCSGMFFCEWRLARSIKHRLTMKNQYTRVMIPGPLFLVVADIFMALSALFHGKLLFSLYKKGRPPQGAPTGPGPCGTVP